MQFVEYRIAKIGFRSVYIIVVFVFRNADITLELFGKVLDLTSDQVRCKVFLRERLASVNICIFVEWLLCPYLEVVKHGFNNSLSRSFKELFKFFFHNYIMCVRWLFEIAGLRTAHCVVALRTLVQAFIFATSSSDFIEVVVLIGVVKVFALVLLPFRTRTYAVLIADTVGAYLLFCKEVCGGFELLIVH